MGRQLCPDLLSILTLLCRAWLLAATSHTIVSIVILKAKNIYLTKKYFQWLVSVLLLAAAAAQDVAENEIADLPSAVGEGITRPISEESRRERLRSGVSSLTGTLCCYHIII